MVTEYYMEKKTTAVWLLQEGERVSSDRLFCVREKQSFALPAVSTTKVICVLQNGAGTPTVCDSISIVFLNCQAADTVE